MSLELFICLNIDPQLYNSIIHFPSGHSIEQIIPKNEPNVQNQLSMKATIHKIKET